MNDRTRTVFGPIFDAICPPAQMERERAATYDAAPAPATPRMARQLAIEDAITSFAPDADEATEILDALTAALRRRYGENEDCDYYALRLRAAIEQMEAA